MMNFILNNLAIGNAQEGSAESALITASLCVAREINLPDTGHLVHKVPIIDMQPIPEPQLEEAVVWIRDHIEEHRILVYCNAGVGRSSSVVIGYLCCILQYGFGDAVEFVAIRRPYMSILPNLILTIEQVAGDLGRDQDHQ
jgi:protein-tyrosine phosphatase